jgi:hypothetical protein
VPSLNGGRGSCCEGGIQPATRHSVDGSDRNRLPGAIALGFRPHGGKARHPGEVESAFLMRSDGVLVPEVPDRRGQGHASGAGLCSFLVSITRGSSEHPQNRMFSVAHSPARTPTRSLPRIARWHAPVTSEPADPIDFRTRTNVFVRSNNASNRSLFKQIGQPGDSLPDSPKATSRFVYSIRLIVTRLVVNGPVRVFRSSRSASSHRISG